ncbi:MAG: ATP phosphoribosyltransferase regulatory subunit [Lachnospiraceae bacterium]|nr:ATP phosphoribosyltransferase regulatory subunit [Lachnospiraceae bacterium]
MKQILHTPDGVRDIYGKDYAKKLQVEDIIHNIFASYGYQDIQTPGFEYFDLFSGDIGTTDTNDLYKFTDSDGQTVVLRSDFTPSIARCAAKYFLEDSEAVRLTYKGNTFVNAANLQGKLKETTQMGVELIGENSVDSDIEIIKLATETLKDVKLKKFKLCIGNVEFFKGLCEELGIDSDTEMTLRDYVSNKNFFGIRDYMLSINMSEDAMNKILAINDLVGGVECLNKALLLVNNERSKLAINRLIEIYNSLEKCDIADHIFFDLGMLSKYRYYTGMIFKGYAVGNGDAIVKGGRYDNLLSQFGKNAPAVGFVAVIDDLLNALRNQECGNDDEYLTFALTKGRLANKTLELLESIGITCEEMKDKDTRKLIFVNEELKLKFFLSKGPDVPTYVESGTADIGVVGKDTIMEENRRVYEVLDLGFGKCRMCVCGPHEAKDLLMHHEMIRVCSKYPVIAKDYFYNKKHQTVDIIKLNGSVELGPIVGLGDVIVDIVETGSTLKENGLEVLEEICDLSARMIVNQVSMQVNNERIRTIIQKLKENLQA